MGDQANLAARYLRGLGGLNSSQGHEARAHLGNLTLQIGLVTEILKRSDSTDPETRAKLERHLAKAQAAAEEVHRAVERLLTATRASEGGSAPVDLREAMREQEGWLAPFLRERGATLSVGLPSERVVLEGDREAIRRALALVLWGAAEAVATGGRLELGLDGGGVLAVAGPPPTAWLPAVAEPIEALGGRAGTPNDATGRVEIRLPVQVRTP